ncbi:unnamed protein product, partial [Ectocarpus sp. 12 AP-2014]
EARNDVPPAPTHTKPGDGRGEGMEVGARRTRERPGIDFGRGAAVQVPRRWAELTDVRRCPRERGVVSAPDQAHQIAAGNPCARDGTA